MLMEAVTMQITYKSIHFLQASAAYVHTAQVVQSIQACTTPTPYCMLHTSEMPNCRWHIYICL